MSKVIYFILVLFLSSINMLGEEWNVKKSDKNLVKFISSTALLDFEGTTSSIDGYIYWEGTEKFNQNNELYFEVDLNSVETGIGKRDRDMREDVLETDKWPKTSFKGTITNAVRSKIDSNKYSISSEGTMFIHGIKKSLNIDAEITISESEMLVESRFSVFLKDYEIEAPSLLAFIKVAEEIKLQVNFHLEKISEIKN